MDEKFAHIIDRHTRRSLFNIPALCGYILKEPRIGMDYWWTDFPGRFDPFSGPFDSLSDHTKQEYGKDICQACKILNALVHE